jgi:hypothetical protein
MNLSKYKIIFIHGMASKLPKQHLLANWKRCLIENIRFYEPNLAADMKAQANNLFDMAYWANVIPSHIEDDPKELKEPIADILKLRTKRGDDFHVSNKRAKFKAFWKNKGLDVVDLVANILTVKDDVAKKLLLEVRLYWDAPCVASKIRVKVEEPLKRALIEDRKVALIGHSMGSFVAYDVLWRFSHHRDAEDMRKKRVYLFCTIGSPLGDPMIQNLMLGKRYGYKEKKGLPTNIEYWVNFAALGDIVSHDPTLIDDFKAMKKLGLIRDFRDYQNLFNPYRNRKGKPNPHKSYGYLLQPKLAKTMLRFFGKINWK